MIISKKNHYISRCLSIIIFVFGITSCSTLETTWDSVSGAGDYVYDSVLDTVMFWEDEEPEESEAIIVEEAIQVPEFALPQVPNYDNLSEDQGMTRYIPQSQMSPPTGYYDNFIYRSARQYYSVSPNGSPMPAPPPPPFPQYSIQQSPGMYNQPYRERYGYGGINVPNALQQQTFEFQENTLSLPQNLPMSEEEEMEIFGIENNCIRVERDLVNGGYLCDDFD